MNDHDSNVIDYTSWAVDTLKDAIDQNNRDDESESKILLVVINIDISKSW